MSQFKILSENKFKAFFQSNAFVEVFFEKKGLARYKYLFGALRIELKSIRHYFVIAYSRLTPLFNPKNPKTFATDSFLTEFERYAKSLGVVDIGYTRLNPGILFYNEKVISKNTIVLSLEMDKDKMNLAPSKATFNMIHETYHNLNMITLKLSNYLRKNGYAAQPSTATLGYGHYPPIAESAGLGLKGWHGLLITPKLGPRQRLALVFTSIENLPIYDLQQNSHSWITDFCSTCKKCVRACPADAIPKDLEFDNFGNQIHIHAKKCVDYFSQNYGCSICIKECTFNKTTYDKLKTIHDRKNKNAT